MIDPHQLLEIATELSRPRGRGAPRQIRLRRSISSSYYALFHFLLAASADLLVGRSERGTPRYSLVYRAPDHRQMTVACKSISSSRNQSAALQKAALLFVELQSERHTADYDPDARLTTSDAETAIIKAQTAMALIGSAPETERRLFLTALLFKPRT